MAQTSFGWPGDSGAGGVGDCGPYQANAFTDWLEKLLCSDSTTECVIPNSGNELAVTGTATPLSVNTGAAFVNGKPYNNSAAVSLAISTPVGATRIDRVILRVDYALQTVRLALLPGAEGGAAPALTQTDGTTWEVSLAQVSITTGGVCTVTDERQFLHFNTDVETNMMEAEAVTAAKIANRTRTFLVPPSVDVVGAGSGQGSALGILMTDAVTSVMTGMFRVPPDFVSSMTIKAVVEPAAAGNVYSSNTEYHRAAGEAYSTHTSAVASAAVAITQVVCEIQTLTLSDVAVGDYFTLQYVRTGGDGLDSINDSVGFLGWLISYTADS